MSTSHSSPRDGSLFGTFLKSLLVLITLIALAIYLLTNGAIGFSLNEHKVPIQQVGTGRKGKLSLDIRVIPRLGAAETKIDIEVEQNYATMKGIYWALRPRHSDKHGYWLGKDNKGFTTSLRNVRRLKITASEAGLAARGGVRIRIRKASIRKTKWYNFFLNLGIVAKGSTITITRDSVNAKGIPGIIDKKVFKKLKITVDLAKELGCNTEDISIESFSTYQKKNRFGIKSTISTTNDCLLKAIKAKTEPT